MTGTTIDEQGTNPQHRADIATSFAAFVFSHAECGEAVFEGRLSERSIACWCLRCDEMRALGQLALP
jgi:hypothetical protein